MNCPFHWCIFHFNSAFYLDQHTKPIYSEEIFVESNHSLIECIFTKVFKQKYSLKIEFWYRYENIDSFSLFVCYEKFSEFRKKCIVWWLPPKERMGEDFPWILWPHLICVTITIPLRFVMCMCQIGLFGWLSNRTSKVNKNSSHNKGISFASLTHNNNPFRFLYNFYKYLYIMLLKWMKNLQMQAYFLLHRK